VGKFALGKGYRLLSISQAYLFQRGINTFRDLIQELNQIKVEAQAANQPSIRNVAKLLMNSMYGRFGMHTEPVQNEIVTLERAREIMKSYQVQDCISLGGLELISYIISLPMSSYPQNNHWNKSINELPGQTNVPLAAAITAYSQMIINQYKIKALESGLQIFYSDTDSLVLNGQLPPELIDASKLGMLKLEHEIEEAYFVAPKVYWLKTTEGAEISKCKGNPGSSLTKDQILTLYEGQSLTLEVTKWSRSLGAGVVRIVKGLPYNIRPNFNKRQKVFDDQDKWVDTKPLILN